MFCSASADDAVARNAAQVLPDECMSVKCICSACGESLRARVAACECPHRTASVLHAQQSQHLARVHAIELSRELLAFQELILQVRASNTSECTAEEDMTVQRSACSMQKPEKLHCLLVS